MITPAPHVLVLTAAPGHAIDLVAMLEATGEAMGTRNTGAVRWLSAREACEIQLGALDGETASCISQKVRKAGENLPVDVNLVRSDGESRRKKLLVCDMDSTIIQQECIDEMADMAGIKPRIAAITERAMRGELDFEAALRERLGLLRGLGSDMLERVFQERISLMPGARVLTATMRAHGAFTALVSGGFTFFTERVAAAAGFDANQANTLELENGKLTGDVVGPVLGQEAKLEALRRFRGQLGLVPEVTMAVGDGANDLAMIREAGLGVAYRAKPVVAAEARASIVHADLTGLLYLQGYAREEFVGA